MWPIWHACLQDCSSCFSTMVSHPVPDALRKFEASCKERLVRDKLKEAAVFACVGTRRKPVFRVSTFDNWCGPNDGELESSGRSTTSFRFILLLKFDRFLFNPRNAFVPENLSRFRVENFEVPNPGDR